MTLLRLFYARMICLCWRGVMLARHIARGTQHTAQRICVIPLLMPQHLLCLAAARHDIVFLRVTHGFAPARRPCCGVLLSLAGAPLYVDITPACYVTPDYADGSLLPR